MAAGDTHIVLVNVPTRELGDRIGVQRNVHFFARGVEARARHSFDWNRILDDFVSFTNSEVAETASKFIDDFEFLHGRRENKGYWYETRRVAI